VSRGQTVRFVVSTDDLDHGIAINELGINLQLHPGVEATSRAVVVDVPDGEDAVHQRDPSITSVTFTARSVGAYDVACVDSGMDGSGTCGWGHKWMVAKSGFVVRPSRRAGSPFVLRPSAAADPQNDTSGVKYFSPLQTNLLISSG
jgi:heme/copper-type cytochrome/quinol oxidase subunit 2